MENNTDIQKRPYAVVLYGATSFVGQITAHYLGQFLSNKKSNDDSEKPAVTWAIAGRDKEKLEKLQSELSKAQDNEETTKKVDIIIANSDDDSSLNEMTKQTQVIISTVGPYLKYGEPLIKSCVINCTVYVDLSGEAFFI